MNEKELLARLARIQNFLEDTPIITDANFGEIDSDIDHIANMVKNLIRDIEGEEKWTRKNCSIGS